jgi:3-oxoadipate enol-lactonase
MMEMTMSLASSTAHDDAMLPLPGGHMRYVIDDYSDPWDAADTVIMLHGIAEEACIWRPFIPHLARQYRVVTVDLRGFGASSLLPPDGQFGLADWADDIEALVAHLQSDRVHLVATKLGALIAFEIAQRQHGWVKSLSLPGMLASPAGSLGAWVNDWIRLVETGGTREWAAQTMPGRMADNLSPAATLWWTDLMGRASAETVIHCFRMLPGIDEAPHPERVLCPTLFLAAEGDAYVSGKFDQRPSASAIAGLQRKVPNSVLETIPANSYHIAATHPDACARKVAAFIAGHSDRRRAEDTQ